MESWTNYVRYLGSNLWELSSEGTDFTGHGRGESFKEEMDSVALIEWVVERDSETNTPQRNSFSGNADDKEEQKLGVRASRLREIASLEEASDCVKYLDGLVKGIGLPKEERPLPRILAVKGVRIRAVWRYRHHTVYEVETTQGLGFLYPPDKNLLARIVLQSEPHGSVGRFVKVDENLLPKLKELWPDLVALRARQAPGNQYDY